MAHYNVLLGHKEKSYDKILEDNCRGEWDGYKINPFGYDYLLEIDSCTPESFKDKDWGISDIIDNNGDNLWWNEGCGSPEPKISFEDALKIVLQNPYLTLFDGHL